MKKKKQNLYAVRCFLLKSMFSIKIDIFYEIRSFLLNSMFSMKFDVFYERTMIKRRLSKPLTESPYVFFCDRGSLALKVGVLLRCFL